LLLCLKQEEIITFSYTAVFVFLLLIELSLSRGMLRGNHFNLFRSVLQTSDGDSKHPGNISVLSYRRNE
jgi:hypothetical protein